MPRHCARSSRERAQRSPARSLALDERPAATRRSVPTRRPAGPDKRSEQVRAAPSRPSSDPSTTIVARDPLTRAAPTDPAPRRPWRTGRALLLSLGILSAMGAALLVFAGGTSAVAPAVAAPAAAPAASAVQPAAKPTGPAALTPTELAKCPAAATACVDLAAHTAWLQRDGKPLTGPVAMLPGTDTGKRAPGPTSSATPTGSFQVQRKDKDGYSSEYDEPMNHAVYFAPGGIAFHEGSLTTTSNGCIHLSAADAARFFDTLRIGDGVHVF